MNLALSTFVSKLSQTITKQVRLALPKLGPAPSTQFFGWQGSKMISGLFKLRECKGLEGGL